MVRVIVISWYRNGQYAPLSLCQTSCVIPVSWDCDGQVYCYDPKEMVSIIYLSVVLYKLSWDCDGQGNCYDPGTGRTVHFTACQSLLVPS